jgi:hypothetical protein
MKTKPTHHHPGTFAAVLAACAMTPVFPLATHAQSGDAILNLLQKKGIISENEAKDLRKETDDNFNKSFRAKTGLPDWVTSLKFSGDFRGRFEQHNAENDAFAERNRYRYRARFGATVSMLDDFEVGLRLSSGDPLTGGANNANPGGNPVTANQTFNSLSSRKFVWLDAAYAKWTPIHNDTWTATGIIGKMDNPFALSNMLWDYDIVPEGAALQLAYNINSTHTLKANGAFFVLDEINQGVKGFPTINGSHDPTLAGGQLLWQSKWTPKFETSFGMAVFTVNNRDSLSAQVQPFYNAGNSRDTNGFLLYNMNPIIGTASATYKLDSFPCYTGAFPLKVSGEFMDNPGAPDNNTGYRVGLTFGKAGHRHNWELDYRYQQLEADAWFDALPDDDNGGYYAKGNPQLTGTGKGSGWFGGTNVRGHLVRATYSLTDCLNFTFSYYLNDLITGAPGQSSDAGHFMADIMWKF